MKKIMILGLAIMSMLISACSTMGTPNYSQNGTVIDMRYYYEEEHVPSVGGAVVGGVAGGVIGNQFGKGNGKTAMTVIGSVIGAGVGAQAGGSRQSVTKAQIWVKMDDGSVENIVSNPRGIAIGKRVNIEKYGENIYINQAK